MIKGERIRLPLFDTTLFQASAANTAAGAEFQLFQTGIGAAIISGGAAKTKLDTNLTVSGQMPYKQMTVIGIRAVVATRNATPAVIADLNQIDNQVTLKFEREDRTILELPMLNFPSGLGLVAGGHATIATRGVAAVGNFMKILPETYITSQRIQVSLKVVSTITLSADTYVAVYLEGLVDKGF